MTPLRIGNASGFYGDRFSALHEMLTGPAGAAPLHVLTGDYLAELTMLILGRDRLRDPKTGYAKTFLRQLEGTLGLALDQQTKIVVNAGGLNPAGLAEAVHELATRLGLHPKIGYVTGDDVLDQFAGDDPGPLTANAYLGGWGITECLRNGAELVITGRVTDAALVTGPAAAHFGWARDDFDALAGALVAGHVLECGAQATGGNYAFFTELSNLDAPPGFPIAEIDAGGSAVITKHPGAGGAVTVGTVTAQLLYEIAGPRYPGPDVTARFDTIALRQESADRVTISGVRGEPPPPDVKVCLNHLAGYRNDLTFVLTGLDIAAKAQLVEAQLAAALQRLPAELTWTLARTDHADAATEETASALLHVTAKDPDPKVAGRAFSAAAVELALSSYPGFTLTSPPADAVPYAVYRAGYLPAPQVPHRAVLPDGRAPGSISIPIAAPDRTQQLQELPEPQPPAWAGGTASQRQPLGLVAGARSGDKGGAVNIGVWPRVPAAWPWLAHTLTVDRLRELLPETANLPVSRYLLPNLPALNFVVDGLLGAGVSAGTRFDPQGKGVGEWLRSRLVDIPQELL